MAKFAEAHARLFKNKFVSKVSKRSIKAPPLKILAGKIMCRKCGARKFRPVRLK